MVIRKTTASPAIPTLTDYLQIPFWFWKQMLSKSRQDLSIPMTDLSLLNGAILQALGMPSFDFKTGCH